MKERKVQEVIIGIVENNNNALREISFKFPIGVPTIYKTLFSGS